MVNGKRYIWFMVCVQYHYVLCNVCLVRCNASQNEKWGYLAASQQGFHRFPSVFFTANKKNSVKSCDNHKAQNKHVWGARWARYLCVLPFDCGRRWPTVRPAVCGLSEINIRLLGRCAARRASGWKATEHRRIVRETMQAERDIRVRVRVRVNTHTCAQTETRTQAGLAE